MSIQRNTPQESEPDYTVPERLPTTAELRQSLNASWAELQSYRAQTEEQAADKYEITLLLTTVSKLCAIQEDFMENVKSELTATLNVQNEYKESVRAEVGKILNHIYAQIEQRQNATHNKMLENEDKSLAKLEEKTNECLTNCMMTEDTVKHKLSEMKKIGSIADFLYITAPLFVIGSFVLKLIELFG